MEASRRFRGQPAIEAGYQHIRLERQGALLAPNTLLYYDRMVAGRAGVRRFEDLHAGVVRAYAPARRPGPASTGQPLAPGTLLEPHRDPVLPALGAARGLQRSTGSPGERARSAAGWTR